MKPKFSLPLPYLVISAFFLVAGVLIGFGLGRSSKPDSVQRAELEGASTTNPPKERAPQSLTGVPTDRNRSRNDSFGEIKRAIEESDPVTSTRRFAAGLELLTAAQAAQAAEVLWTTPADSREMNERKRLLGYRWGQLAGAKSVEFAQAQTGKGKLAAISAALAGWASSDPAAAKGWIDDQVDPGVRMLYDVALVDGWARHDPAATSDYVIGMPKGPNTERMIKIVAGEQLRQDPAAAGSWALALPEPSLRATAVDEVATRWVWADAPAALDWVARIPTSGQMQSTMRTAAGIWARTDPGSAGEYLNEMPEGEARDYAVSAYSLAVAVDNFETGTAWAATISNLVLREESLAAIGSE